MITIYLNGREYAQVDSMWNANLCLEDLAEKYPDLEYTDPECGCIYVSTESFDPTEFYEYINQSMNALLSMYATTSSTLTRVTHSDTVRKGNKYVILINNQPREVELIDKYADSYISGWMLSFQEVGGQYMIHVEEERALNQGILFFPAGTVSHSESGVGCRNHEYVNVGFMSIRMACKHCGVDKDE